MARLKGRLFDTRLSDRRTGRLLLGLGAVFAGLVLTGPAWTQDAQNDIPKVFTTPLGDYDYVKGEVMIPMRDGVKLHTVLVIPGAPGTHRFC